MAIGTIARFARVRVLVVSVGACKAWVEGPPPLIMIACSHELFGRVSQFFYRTWILVVVLFNLIDTKGVR